MVEFEVFATFQGELENRMGQFNARMAKNGLPPIEYVVVDNGVEDADGRAKVTVMMDNVLPHYEGWSLVSKLEFVEGFDAALLSTVPGETTPDEFRLGDSTRCDHCGVRRFRTKAFVVRGPDGKYAQIGSTCLALYLPKSALALINAEWVIDALGDLMEDGLSDDFYYGAGREMYDLRVLVNLTLRVIANTGWVSATKARDEGIASTAAIVSWVFGKTGRERKEWMDDNPKQSRYNADDVIAFCQTMPGASDYAHNIRALAGAKFVPPSKIGFVASMPAAYIRSLEEQAPKPTAPAPTGRVTIVGEIISLKEVHTDWGPSTKAVIAVEPGWRLYVTLPGAIDHAVRGDVVSMSVDVTPSRDDVTFAFGKRPTKARFVSTVN